MTNHDERASSLAGWGAAPDGVLEDLDLKYKRWSVGWSIVNQRDTQSLPSNDLCQERVRSATRCHTQARDNGMARGKGEGKTIRFAFVLPQLPRHVWRHWLGDHCGTQGVNTNWQSALVYHCVGRGRGRHSPPTLLKDWATLSDLGFAMVTAVAAGLGRGATETKTEKLVVVREVVHRCATIVDSCAMHRRN